MNDLYDLIANIKQRPTMYLGRTSVTNLRTFLAGYSFAWRQAGIPQTEQEQQFSEFQIWVQQRFNLPSNQTWDQIILFFSEDEHSAWRCFFQLFEEFQQAHGANVIPANGAV